MPKKEFVLRGKTASGPGTETISLGGLADGYAFQLIAFELWPSTNLGGQGASCWGALTRSSSPEDPINPDFSDDALIATASARDRLAQSYGIQPVSVINDLVLLTQDLTLSIHETQNNTPVNWQLKFKKVKVTAAAEAVANYNAFAVRD